LTRAGVVPAFDELLPTQWWYRDAGALVLLTAVFERTQWRYEGPRAYRAVLIEAGHACQTFCLAATWLGLAPFCSMALADTAIENLLGLDGVSESVLYAAGVGSRPPRSSSSARPPGAIPAHRQTGG
jgi:SagB-type dehydrogenase family enzyme